MDFACGLNHAARKYYLPAKIQFSTFHASKLPTIFANKIDL
jgi:hypothetical protein